MNRFNDNLYKKKYLKYKKKYIEIKNQFGGILPSPEDKGHVGASLEHIELTTNPTQKSSNPEQKIYAVVIEEIDNYSWESHQPGAVRKKTYKLYSFYSSKKVAEEAAKTEAQDKFYNNPLWNYEDRLDTSFKIYEVINGIPMGTTKLLYGVVNNRDNTMRFYKSNDEVTRILDSKIVDEYYKENIYNFVTVFPSGDYNILPTLVNSGFFINNDSDSDYDM